MPKEMNSIESNNSIIIARENVLHWPNGCYLYIFVAIREAVNIVIIVEKVELKGICELDVCCFLPFSTLLTQQHHVTRRYTRFVG